jgi:hypothetical protein
MHCESLVAVAWGQLLLTFLLARRFLSPWWWRRYVPLKHRFLQEPHGVPFQKTTLFTVGSQYQGAGKGQTKRAHWVIAYSTVWEIVSLNCMCPINPVTSLNPVFNHEAPPSYDNIYICVYSCFDWNFIHIYWYVIAK